MCVATYCKLILWIISDVIALQLLMMAMLLSARCQRLISFGVK